MNFLQRYGRNSIYASIFECTNTSLAMPFKNTLAFSLYFIFFCLSITSHAQTSDSTKQELAYWYKHPAEWKAHKNDLLKKKEFHKKQLDSAKSFQVFRHKLQETYDNIADRAEIADSLTLACIGQKTALLKQKSRDKHNLIFKIQIQLAKKHELDAYALPNTYLTIEKIDKGQKRYMLGKFNIYEEAQAFIEILRNNGATVYLVAYKNGHRVQNFAQYLD